MLSAVTFLVIVALFKATFSMEMELSTYKKGADKLYNPPPSSCPSQNRNTKLVEAVACRTSKLLEDRLQNAPPATGGGGTASTPGGLGDDINNPADSCAALLQQNANAPSGYYYVRDINGDSRRVFCDMTRNCGGVTGGWTRIEALNMRDSSQQCPEGLTLLDSINGRRTCGISSTSCGTTKLAPFLISSLQLNYTRICGRIKAYQVGTPDTFRGTQTGKIDGNYVDGIVLTYGYPRKHIWTFAAGLDEYPATFPQYNCPCGDTQSNSGVGPPPFVGNDHYFCDTGSTGHYEGGRFYFEDPLWDGAGCGPTNACCAFNNPPWFFRDLGEETSSNIEVRVCNDEGVGNENIAVEEVEIFIQ